MALAAKWGSVAFDNQENSARLLTAFRKTTEVLVTLHSGPIKHTARIIFQGDDKQAHQQARDMIELCPGTVVYDWGYSGTPELPEYSQEVADLYAAPVTLHLEDDPSDPVLRVFQDEARHQVDTVNGREAANDLEPEPDPPLDLPTPPDLDVMKCPYKHTNKKGHLDLVYRRMRKSIPRGKRKRLRVPQYTEETLVAIGECTLDGTIPVTRGFITERLAWTFYGMGVDGDPKLFNEKKCWAAALRMTLKMSRNGVLKLVKTTKPKED